MNNRTPATPNFESTDTRKTSTMTAATYELQGQARIRVAARVPADLMAFHVSPVSVWSCQGTNALGTTTKPGAPPRPTSVSAP